MDKNFYTLRGYDRKDNADISLSMEDYLEMIYRLVIRGEYVRINQLAALLNVTPSASSKMVTRLKEKGMVNAEHYGAVTLTPLGRELGAYLLHRHNVLHSFFCSINKTEDELELVEKVEHFFDQRTIQNIEKLLDHMEEPLPPPPPTHD